MSTSTVPNHAVPPRLLLGAALLAWGALTHHPLIGLGAALLVESSNWISWRWQFNLRAYSRAWILSLIILAGVVGYYSLNITGPLAVLVFLQWLPLIFLPLILAQQYGEANAVPTAIFSVIARYRLKRERLLGKKIPESRIHIGYPYFFLIILATAFPIGAPNKEELEQQWQFFIILILLGGFALYFSNGKTQRRFIPWLVSLILIGGSSFLSSRSLVDLYFWVKEGGFFTGKSPENVLSKQNTAIGKLGELKLSRRIEWRVNVPKGQEPPLRLLTQAYNHYRGGHWSSHDPDSRSFEQGFGSLLTTVNAKDKGEFAFTTEGFETNEQTPKNKSYVRIRGAVDEAFEPLPSPGSPVLFTEASEIEDIEQSSLGTLLAINANNVIDVKIYTGSDPSLREEDPKQRVINGYLHKTSATQLPYLSKERKSLLSIVSALGLNKLNEQQKIAHLKAFFQENYRYTTHLKIEDTDESSALEKFLTDSREGHCEYFATATTLLLRTAGIPAHYVVGFAVQEEGTKPNEYLVRGTHAHAWCRAYLGGKKTIVEETTERTIKGKTQTITIQREIWSGGKWVDVDLTPAGWLTADSPKPNFLERLMDRFQRLREDFQIWRANEKNRGWVNLALVLIAILLVAFIIWRLSTSRIRKEKKKASTLPNQEFEPTSLNLLLPKLERHYGPKPSGQLLSTWLTSTLTHLPSDLLQRLLDLHEQKRFSSLSFDSSQKQEFEALVQTVADTYAQPKEGSF